MSSRSPVPRLRTDDPTHARVCGGTCGGPALLEVIRQWSAGAWYDVEQVRCRNVRALTLEQRKALRAARDLRPNDSIKCNWRQELSRVARPDIPPPTLQKVEVPKMATKAKTPPCPKCGGTGEKWRIGDRMMPTCRDCVRKQQSESAKKRHLKEAERREHAKRLAAEDADRHFEVEMAAAELTQVDEQSVADRIPVLSMRPYAGDKLGGTEVCSPSPTVERDPLDFLRLRVDPPLVSTNDVNKAERDPLDVVTEQLLAMPIGDLMKRKKPVRVAVFALLRACGKDHDEDGE